MKHKPDIKTAIPKRRYQIGPFTTVVLGDVQSDERADYLFVLAVVREGDSEPGMYITAERTRGAAAGQGDVCMRIIMGDGEEVLGANNAWRDIDTFSNEAISIVKTVLQLSDEEPYRLL